MLFVLAHCAVARALCVVQLPQLLPQLRSRIHLSGDTCWQKYLNGGWAFLLAHDPPGLWQNLEQEAVLLNDTEKLTNGLIVMACAGQVGPGSVYSQCVQPVCWVSVYSQCVGSLTQKVVQLKIITV